MKGSTLLVGVGVTLSLAACGTGDGRTVTFGSPPPTTAAATTAAAVPTTAPTAAAKPAPVAVGTSNIGATAEINVAGASGAAITPSLTKVTQAATSKYGSGPANGNFLIFSVVVVANGAVPFDVNSADFYVRLPDGTRFDFSAGNGFQAAGDNALHFTTLNVGERLVGTVAFDVPAVHGELVYAPAARAVAVWTF